MPIQTPETYYSDENLYGKYQYVSLKEIIDEMLVQTTDTDNYLANTRRSLMVTHAKNGIQELNKAVKRNILSFERAVGEDLYFPLPQDYVDWVRVSVVGDDFRLNALKVNNNIPTAIGYLQDNDYELLFDNDGNILMADSVNLYNKPYTKYTFDRCGYNIDNGDFVIDERRGTIGFSSNLYDKKVVVEYCSDGLEMHNLSEEEITIHKHLKRVLKEWIYMECVSGRRNVPMNEKVRTKNTYKSLLHKAKMDKMHFNITSLAQTVKHRSNQ